MCASRNISFNEREHALVCRDCGNVVAGTPVKIDLPKEEAVEIVYEKKPIIKKSAVKAKKNLAKKKAKKAKKKLVKKKAKKKAKKPSKKKTRKAKRKGFLRRLLKRR